MFLFYFQVQRLRTRRQILQEDDEISAEEMTESIRPTRSRKQRHNRLNETDDDSDDEVLSKLAQSRTKKNLRMFQPIE